MATVLIIILVIIALLVIFFIVGFNKLKKADIHAEEALGGIDVQLTRRADLIPNLVETVKGYAKHEREVLERVTAARNAAAASNGTPAEQAKDENALVGSIKTLFAVSERYPDLKANTVFLGLQDELANTEDRIQAARRFYNGNVRDLNTRIEVFPSSLIASMFGFQRADFFEVEEATVRAAPAVSLSR